ncbi:MAG TPA: chloride channel protein [Balneolaceae bacterium]
MQKPSDNFRIFFVSGLAAVIGLVSGFIAYLLYLLIGFLGNLIFFQEISTALPEMQYHTLGWLVIIIPAIGGLIVAVMAKYGTPKIKGHGIPEAMEAVLTNKSKIHPKVGILKPLSAAIAIGTGGPYGAEGPIIQTGGAFGSVLGQLVRTSATERKVLLACGAAGGMAATFNTPIAAVIIAIELLLFEFKARSFIPLVISSALATAVHFFLIGSGPLIEMVPTNFGIPEGLPFYIILGLICGVAAVGFKRMFYWVEDQFEKLPVDEFWLPAIGGLGLGIIAYFFPMVLGIGYDIISGILNNEFTLTILISIMVFKSLALMLSLGSGTSGGLLAPMFMSGAALGGAYAIILNMVIPGIELAPGAYALVAMAAVFGAASRSTFALIIFAFEITQDYDAILPLMLVCVIADAIGLLLMKNTIMTEKLERRGLRVQQDYEVDVLFRVTVGEVMDPDPQTVAENTPLKDLADKITSHDPSVTRHQGLLIVDDENNLKGIVTRGDVIRNLRDISTGNNTVLEAGTTDPVLTYPDELLHTAIEKMISNDIGRLPVVERDNPKKIAGYLGRTGILDARSKYYHEASQREREWFKGSASITG